VFDMTMEKLVQKSLREYLAMQDMLSQLTVLLEKGQTDALMQAQREWQNLNAEARETDRRMHVLMQDLEPSEKARAAVQEKKRIMSEIRQQCEELQKKARTLQALTADELHRLKTGRKALGGYRASNRGSGNTLLGSC
jgi:phosphoserine aminotransferase